MFRYKWSLRFSNSDNVLEISWKYHGIITRIDWDDLRRGIDVSSSSTSSATTRPQFDIPQEMNGYFHHLCAQGRILWSFLWQECWSIAEKMTLTENAIFAVNFWLDKEEKVNVVIQVSLKFIHYDFVPFRHGDSKLASSSSRWWTRKKHLCL